jgi:ABC-2 type transport system permease protein
MALVAAALTAIGLLLASRIGQVESFQAVISFIVLPLFFLSGAIFPPSSLPGWLSVLTRVDPLSYAVDPMRRAVFTHVSAPASLERTLNPGISWGAWHLPVSFELGLVALGAVAALLVAVWQFNRAE